SSAANEGVAAGPLLKDVNGHQRSFPALSSTARLRAEHGARLRRKCGAQRVEVKANACSGQRDRRHEPAVVGLPAVSCPAVAEEALFVSVRVEPHVVEPSDASPGGALGDIGLEIEHRIARPPARNEETVPRLSSLNECGDELGTDLVGLLGDAGA